MADAYLPPTHYTTPERLNPPAIVQMLSAEELNRIRRSPLELMIAQSGNAPQKTNSIDYSKHTVDDVLNDSPYIKKIRLEDVDKEKANGLVVLFLYDQKNPPLTTSINEALMWKTIAPEFPDIKILALEYLGSHFDKEYAKLGFTATPGFAFFHNGQRVFVYSKGPINEEELNKGIETSRRNLTKLRKLKSE